MKIKIINLIILIVALAGTFVAVSTLPDIVPVHFDMSGTVDRWGSKYELLVMPGAMLAMFAFWMGMDVFYAKKLSTTTDEKEIAEAKSNMKVLNATSVITSLMFLVINGVTIYAAYSQLGDTSVPEIDMLKILTIIMGASFVLLGNFMPKAKNNATIGFRFPWTRYNDVTWSKSNRAGGIAMVISGIVIALGGLIFSGTVAMIIMLVSVAVVLPALLIFAYTVYSQEVKKSEEEN